MLLSQFLPPPPVDLSPGASSVVSDCLPVDLDQCLTQQIRSSCVLLPAGQRIARVLLPLLGNTP